MEGEPKVKNVITLAQKILPNTAPQGREVIMRDADALRVDWEAFIMALAKVRESLFLVSSVIHILGGEEGIKITSIH